MGAGAAIMKRTREHIRERKVHRLIPLLRDEAKEPLLRSEVLDATCLAAFEASRDTLVELAALRDGKSGWSTSAWELLSLLALILDGRIGEAWRRVGRLGDQPLHSSHLLAIRLALAHNQLDQAVAYARQLAERHPKGERCHPDVTALTSGFWIQQQANVQPRPRRRLSLCSSLKNEAEYLEEWVRYHAGIGVDHFYLYDNGSTDQTPEIIAALAKEFSITSHCIEAQPGQTIAMNHFLKTHRTETEWVALIDGDEFINLERARQIIDVLRGGGDVAAFACSWANFGSNGHDATPPGRCVEAFTRRAEGRNAHVKMIARADRLIRMVNPHEYMVLGPVLNGAGVQTMIFQGKIEPPACDEIRINHYMVKSREQWRAKMKRGRPLPDDHAAKSRDEAFFLNHDRNEVLDESILRLV